MADQPATITIEDVEHLVHHARELLERVSFDEHGTMVAGKFVGGNGGLLSRETVIAADALRVELARITAIVAAYQAGQPG